MSSCYSAVRPTGLRRRNKEDICLWTTFPIPWWGEYVLKNCDSLKSRLDQTRKSASTKEMKLQAKEGSFQSFKKRCGMCHIQHTQDVAQCSADLPPCFLHPWRRHLGVKGLVQWVLSTGDLFWEQIPLELWFSGWCRKMVWDRTDHALFMWKLVLGW